MCVCVCVDVFVDTSGSVVMEQLDRSTLAQIIGFLGEPTPDAPAHVVGGRLSQIFSLWWTTSRIAALVWWWWDNEMDVSFHP